MKHTFSLILVTLTLFFEGHTAQQSKFSGQNEGGTGLPVQPSNGTLRFAANSMFMDEGEGRNPSSHRVKQPPSSCKERCVRMCCVPMFLHCLGALVCCRQCCDKKS